MRPVRKPGNETWGRLGMRPGGKPGNEACGEARPGYPCERPPDPTLMLVKLYICGGKILQ